MSGSRLWIIGPLACLMALAMPPHAAFAQNTVVFELIEIVPDATNPIQPTIEDGHTRVQDPDHNPPNWTSDHSWTSPPKQIGAEGVKITLKVDTTGILTSGTGLSGNGFEFDVQEPIAWVHGKKKDESASLDVIVKPTQGAGPTAQLKIGAAYYGGVTYRYRALETTGGGEDADDGDSDDGDDDGDQSRVLAARLDCPDTITISALPSLNCHILISGWRRNTADPVEVLFPAAIDTFGNHANGIQIPQGPGAEDVFNWDDPEHSWGFFVFACPSQQNTGANCYDSVTVPGPVSVPIIVRQKGQQDVNLTLSLIAVARGGDGSATASGNVRVGNRFRVGDFINIESGTLVSGAIKADWLSAIWSIMPVEGTEFVRLCNVWKP